MKKLTFLILLALLPVVASAYDAYIDGIYYNFSGNEAEVTHRYYTIQTDYIGAVIIPEYVIYGKTYSVTGIGDKAFSGCYELTAVTIPGSVTSIGELAFAECNNLEDVYCYAEDVPETHGAAFGEVPTFAGIRLPIVSATLHVPAGSVEKYRATYPWSEFGNIVEMTSSKKISPFVQDGKVWIYEGRNYNGGVWEEIFSLEGDTVIDSRPCTKLYITYTWSSPPYPPYNHDYYGAMYEEGGKVYVIARDSTTPVLLYDFSSVPGAVVKVGDFEVKITKKKLVKYRGEYLKDIYYSYYDDLTQEFSDDVGLDWIEGVGVCGGANLTCFIDGYGPWFDGGIRYIKSCTVNGEVVFDADEYSKTAQIVSENEVTFTKDQIATIILPTAPDASKGKYYRLDRWEDNQIIFEQELHPQARVPYIIVPNEDFFIDLDTIDIEGLRTDTAMIEGVYFVGTYSKKNVGYKDYPRYFVLDTTPDFSFESGSMYVGALRAFFEISIRYCYMWRQFEYVLHDYGTDLSPVTYTEGQMATIILPTEPDASKGKYYRLDRCENGQIVFEQELHPQARTPYIIVPDEDFSIDPSTLDLEGLSSDTVTVGDISFIGSYISKELPALTGGDGGGSSFYYEIIDSTPDCQRDEAFTIGALRAYLTIRWDDPINPGGERSPQEKKGIVLKDYETNISLTPDPSPGRGEIYDLSGRKWSMVHGKWSMPKGIYIENGKKIVR